MRLRTLIGMLALGYAARAFIRSQNFARARASVRGGADLQPDPADPVQGFVDVAELELEDLDVDALSNEDIEAAKDLAALESELDDGALALSREDRDPDAVLGERVDADLVGTDARPRDAGDLYGGHTPIAVDRTHPDDDQAFVDGQNWVEALETSAVENGAEPERELDDIVDDEELLRTPHPSNRRDTPVADYGAGGRRGL